MGTMSTKKSLLVQQTLLSCSGKVQVVRRAPRLLVSLTVHAPGYWGKGLSCSPHRCVRGESLIFWPHYLFVKL
jgi:hypothetical protein